MLSPTILQSISTLVIKRWVISQRTGVLTVSPFSMVAPPLDLTSDIVDFMILVIGQAVLQLTVMGTILTFVW